MSAGLPLGAGLGSSASFTVSASGSVFYLREKINNFLSNNNDGNLSFYIIFSFFLINFLKFF